MPEKNTRLCSHDQVKLPDIIFAENSICDYLNYSETKHSQEINLVKLQRLKLTN